jgi:CDP-glycerol glycerophosphotransferase (TagB/SpsB family)
LALNHNFTSKDGNAGNYINFNVFIEPKKSTDAPNTRQAILKINYWKDNATRQIAGAIPMDEEMNGGPDSRIVGFKGIYKFAYDLTSTKNVFDQGYDFLKTLPEFTGAINA